MDKKKVKELIEDTLLMVDTIEGFDDGDTEQLLNVRRKLNGALEELSKSDWVSVEDGLPEYGEEVLVCNKNFNKYLIAIRHHMGIDRQLDKNGFIKGFGITHWKPIEKLED